MCLIDFRNFLTIHAFGVKESMANISTELPCLGYVTSCYVMSRNSRKSRHVTSCYVMSRNFTLCHATSCHVMSHNVTSCHVMPRHVLHGHVTSCHVNYCHVVSRHVTLRHATSWHVMSRRKSRDGHTTNASLSTVFFHTQLIWIKHDRVRWLSRRLPIPYRISGIWSSLIICYWWLSMVYLSLNIKYNYWSFK